MVGWETHFFFMHSEKELEEIAFSVLEETEYKIIELVVRGEKRTKVLELYVDRREGVNIDELAGLSRKLEELIESGPFAGELSKIVISSPGAERPFRYIWQLDKHIGRNLEVVLNDDTKTEGRILEVDDEAGTIRLAVVQEGKKKTDPVEVDLKFENMKEAKVKISFSKK